MQAYARCEETEADISLMMQRRRGRLGRAGGSALSVLSSHFDSHGAPLMKSLTFTAVLPGIPRRPRTVERWRKLAHTWKRRRQRTALQRRHEEGGGNDL